ncbi:diguanylate cyclase [uncultured Umboniibacter sp.]|uniref:GGDEF domain-containing protein n=1 Tax=uncultured Umboniibacter sp. TaxID=1798917 RepID=UPI002632471E|nr:diguanylate cyclase [uncultured Umboniibacter sp.]
MDSYFLIYSFIVFGFAINGLSLYLSGRVNRGERYIPLLSLSQVLLSLSACFSITARLLGYAGPTEEFTFAELLRTLSNATMIASFFLCRYAIGGFIHSKVLVKWQPALAFASLGVLGVFFGMMIRLPESWSTFWVNLFAFGLSVQLTVVLSRRLQSMPMWILFMAFLFLAVTTSMRAVVNLFDMDATPRRFLDMVTMASVVVMAYLVNVGVVIEANRRVVNTLTKLSSLDPLTGLLNRRSFFEEVTKRLDQSAVSTESTVMYIDVDGFKQVNDEHGHPAGDDMLQSLAGYLSKRLRSSDLTSRVGGDEFVAYLHGTTLANAQRLAEALRRDVEELARSRGLSCSLSFGLVSVSKGEALRSAVGRADAALYQAKSQGGNQVVLG